MNENLENEATIQPEETAQEHETVSRPDGQDAAAQEQPPAMEAAAEKTEEGDSGKDDAQEHTGKEAEDPRQHDAALARVTQRAAEAELRAAAALAGVSAERLPYVVRLCDAAALTAKDADMVKLAQAQVAAVLKAVPELGTRPAAGSLGDHKRVREGTAAEDDTRATFAKYL